MTDYLRGAWYMAAWSDEIGEALLRRQMLGEPILLYRRSDGAVAALTDRCPHRFAPLSRGQREGDNVRCPYHGLMFDAAGACVHNPFSEKLPKGASVRAWPTVERDGIVWLWAADAAAADEALIPDFGQVWRGPGGPPITGLMPLRANYEYATDNLMDLSHIEFVHKGSFAGAGVIFAGRHEVRQEGDTLHSDWWMPDVAAPAHTSGIYDREMRTDHWLDMRWNAPASMLLEIGATPAGRPRAEGVIVRQAHILTPETDGSAHYFWATTRSSGEAGGPGDAIVRELMTQAFGEEDKPIIEAAFANLDGAGFWESQPVFIGIDAGGTRARRLLASMIERERRAATAPRPVPA
jgi:vanillate O-demethylase monooxygenase subunit